MFQPVEDGGLATAVQPNHHTMVASTAAQAHQARHETLLPDGGAHDQGQLSLPNLTMFLFSLSQFQILTRHGRPHGLLPRRTGQNCVLSASTLVLPAGAAATPPPAPAPALGEEPHQHPIHLVSPTSRLFPSPQQPLSPTLVLLMGWENFPPLIFVMEELLEENKVQGLRRNVLTDS